MLCVITTRGATLLEDSGPDAPTWTVQAVTDVTWAGDITYMPTAEGWRFLSTLIDLFSRRGHRLGRR
jgi:transposase InsO family protein